MSNKSPYLFVLKNYKLYMERCVLVDDWDCKERLRMLLIKNEEVGKAITDDWYFISITQVTVEFLRSCLDLNRHIDKLRLECDITPFVYLPADVFSSGADYNDVIYGP